MGAQEVRPHGAPGLPGPQVEASSPGQDGQLRDYCASGLYILTLLLEGYGFSQETWGGIEFREQKQSSPVITGLQVDGLMQLRAPSSTQPSSKDARHLALG